MVCKLKEPYKEKNAYMELYRLPFLSESDSWQIEPEDLAYGDKIGEGHFGEVWRGTFHQLDVAIKLIKLDENDKSNFESFKQEVCIMKNIRHKYVLSLFGCVIFPFHNVSTL